MHKRKSFPFLLLEVILLLVGSTYFLIFSNLFIDDLESGFAFFEPFSHVFYLISLGVHDVNLIFLFVMELLDSTTRILSNE